MKQINQFFFGRWESDLKENRTEKQKICTNNDSSHTTSTKSKNINSSNNKNHTNVNNNNNNIQDTITPNTSAHLSQNDPSLPLPQ